jgi:hypothetical protein
MSDLTERQYFPPLAFNELALYERKIGGSHRET